MSEKKILIINTGGTISSIQTPHGYQPLEKGVADILSTIPALSHPSMPIYTIEEYSPLLDSSNMTPTEWNRIANDIKNAYDQVDGIVIFHGTDTMAYTASALSFMLEHLNKPVILTGSQLPLSEVRSDALDNVITSMWLAAHESINEVCIYFNQRLLRGNRAQKTSVSRFNAFDSPNYPHLADVGVNISLRQEHLLKKSNRPFSIQAINPHPIVNLKLFPGYSIDLLETILHHPSLNALILETYGAGNAPNINKQFLRLLREASDRGILIINCTQCQHGSVQMGHYETGYTLLECGVLSGFDMTTEAVHTKLLYLLSKYQSHSIIVKKMQDALVGELSPFLIP